MTTKKQRRELASHISRGRQRRELASHISRVGWAVALMCPCGCARHGRDHCVIHGTRGYCFTIGLWKTFGHPELLCIGLRLEVSSFALNLAGQGVKDGCPVPLHEPVPGLVEGFSARFRPVTEAAVRRLGVGAAEVGYGAHLPPFLQLVYPDRAGRFPEELGVNPALLRQQPLLALRALS